MPIPAGTEFPSIPVVHPALTGTAPAPAAVAGLRSVNGNLVAYGAVLEVANTSGGPVDVAFIDPGRTPAGNPGDHPPVEVADGTTEYFKLDPAMVDRATNVIVVAFDAVPGITAQVIY